jgi:energy-converting hydrogenase Eha subunit A
VPITTVAIAVMLAIAAGAVVVASLIVLQPMWREDQAPGSWTTSLMIGTAVTLLGAGAIVVAVRDDQSTTIEVGLFLVGGFFGAVGLTMMGIGFFNLARDEGEDFATDIDESTRTPAER